MPDGNENLTPQQPASQAAPETKPAAPPTEQVGLRVSLIPEEELNRRDPRAGFRKWLIATIIAVVAMGGTCAFLAVSIYLSKQQITALNDKTDSLVKQSYSLSASLSDTKLTQSRLRAISSLLGSHRDVAKIFSFMERHTLVDVAYSSISIAENGNVNLTATASSYEAYAGQLNELSAQPEIKGVTASGLSPVYDPNGNFQAVNFSLALAFDPSIFLLKSK